jgi:hypothetical protein
MGNGEIGELLRRSTVHIRSTNRRRQSAGSGVIWDNKGTINTNAHVVSDGTHLPELWGGRSLPAEIEARDDPRDLAADTPFTTAADLANVIAEAAARLRLRFLRDDNRREREVVISLCGRCEREAA